MSLSVFVPISVQNGHILLRQKSGIHNQRPLSKTYLKLFFGNGGARTLNLSITNGGLQPPQLIYPAGCTLVCSYLTIASKLYMSVVKHKMIQLYEWIRIPGQGQGWFQCKNVSFKLKSIKNR